MSRLWQPESATSSTIDSRLVLPPYTKGRTSGKNYRDELVLPPNTVKIRGGCSIFLTTVKLMSCHPTQLRQGEDAQPSVKLMSYHPMQSRQGEDDRPSMDTRKSICRLRGYTPQQTTLHYLLALDYYNAMPAVRHDVVIYSDSLSCLQAIQGEDTEHPLMCRIMNLLWKLSDKGTHVKFCWIPSHCGIEGNEAADKLAKESLGLNIDALLGIFHADLKPQVNAYVQQLMQVKWDVEVHGRDLYLLKANLAPPDRYKHLKRAEEVAMTRLRIGHCKATKGHIVSRGPPAVCHHCGSTLSREHILLECGTVQELRGEFYEADSLTSLFECVRPLAIIEYLKEAGFFYLIWQVYECEIRNVKSHKPQNPDYHIIEQDKWIAENIRKMCRTANMSWRTCVVVKQTQSHPIPLFTTYPGGTSVFRIQDITPFIRRQTYLIPVLLHDRHFVDKIESEIYTKANTTQSMHDLAIPPFWGDGQ